MKIKIPGVTEEVIAEKYYHGLIPREDVPELLKKNGHFLLRITEPSIGMAQSVVISVMCDEDQPIAKGIKHYVIRQDKEGRFHCERKSYSTIPRLIETYVREKIPLDGQSTFRISKPVERKNWEFANTDVTIEKKLGEGAYGEVCLGKVKGRSVAIKQNHMGNLNKEQIKEVMSEARTMRKLRHPNVVEFVGIAALDEPLLIIMELATGSLDSYLQKQGESVSPQRKAEMCHDLACALVFLEARNYLHRDIALRNCLLVGTSVKLSDFGKCQPGPTYQMDPKEKLPIRWLAPDTMRQHVFNFSTEVWSFGITCWEIYANGQEPYPGMMVREVNDQVVKGYKMQMPADTPHTVKMLIESRTWAPPDERANITEVENRLQKITGRRNQIVSEPRPPSKRDPASSPRKKNKEKSHKHSGGKSSKKKHKHASGKSGRKN